MSWFFTPPITFTNPAILPTTTGIKRALFKYYGDNPVGHNVYQLDDGTITESPIPEDVQTIWFGGHEGVVVSDEVAAALDAAGYGENLELI